MTGIVVGNVLEPTDKLKKGIGNQTSSSAYILADSILFSLFTEQCAGSSLIKKEGDWIFKAVPSPSNGVQPSFMRWASSSLKPLRIL